MEARSHFAPGAEDLDEHGAVCQIPQIIFKSQPGEYVFVYFNIRLFMSPIQALMVATHLNVGTVARGTEAVSQTYRGSELGGEQSFRLCAGLGTFASIYMKTRHLNKATRVLRFLPDILTEWLIKYFVLIRPVETQFSQLFYGQDTAYSYQRFMWMQQGC